MRSRDQPLFLLVPVLVGHTIFKMSCSMNRKINTVWFLVYLFLLSLRYNTSYMTLFLLIKSLEPDSSHLTPSPAEQEVASALPFSEVYMCQLIIWYSCAGCQISFQEWAGWLAR